MKKRIQALLQWLLGFERYLFVFARYKAKSILNDRKEGDFSFLLNQISETHHVLDIGANIGIMTVHLAKKAKYVWAFEPMPLNINTLHKMIAHHQLKNVTVFPIALGNESKQTQMILPVVQSVKMQGLTHVLHEEITEFNEGETFWVEQVKLDMVEALRSIRIEAIKLDVENYEYQVLLGASELIRKNTPLIYCELWDNENRIRTFNLVTEWGYKVYVLRNKQLVPYHPNQYNGQNFFFKHHTHVIA